MADSEKKPEGFHWPAPSTTGARAAASVNAPGLPAPPTWGERLKSPYVLAALLGLVLLAGGGLFALTALSVGGTEGSVVLGGLPAGRKAFSRQTQDRVWLRLGARDDASQDRMKIATQGAKAGKAGGAGGGSTGDGYYGEDEAPAPMKYDTGGPSRVSAAAAGGAAAQANTGDGGSSDGGGSASAPKLASRVEFRGMRATSPNAGFRGLSSGRALLRRTSGSRGVGASSSGGTSQSAAGDSGSAAVTTGGSGGSRGVAGALSGDDDSVSGGAGSGGGGGGGGGADMGELEVTDPKERIQQLMAAAAKDAKKADDEKKKAEFLAAGGHLPQAHYHYERSRKAKAASKEKSDQAQQLINSINGQVVDYTETATRNSASEPVRTR